MAGQEILAAAYVLVGLALASAPIVYVLVLRRSEIATLFASIPKYAFAIAGVILVDADGLEAHARLLYKNASSAFSTASGASSAR